MQAQAMSICGGLFTTYPVSSMQVEIREMTFRVTIVKLILECWLNLRGHCHFHPAFKPVKAVFLEETKLDEIIFKRLICHYEQSTLRSSRRRKKKKEKEKETFSRSPPKHKRAPETADAAIKR